MKHTLLAATVIGLAIACAPFRRKVLSSGRSTSPAKSRPILAKNCFACHGPDEKHREAGLRLDLRASAVKKLDDGKTAIVPGHVEASELVRRITTTVADDRMPPADAPTTLTKEQIGLLTGWVAQGAQYSLHWSFEKPQLPAVPHVSRADWPANPIDRFVMAKLDQAGMTPAPEADAHTLARRLSLDLRGLPPSPGEVGALFATAVRPRTSDWWIACWPIRPLASGGPVRGSTWPAMPTRPVMPPIRFARSGFIVIG